MKELLNKDSNPVPDTENTMDLENSFGEFFIGKINNTREKIDKCTGSDNVQMFDVSFNVSADICFDQFANVSDDELPNALKNLVSMMFCLRGFLNSMLVSCFPLLRE